MYTRIPCTQVKLYDEHVHVYVFEEGHLALGSDDILVC